MLQFMHSWLLNIFLINRRGLKRISNSVHTTHMLSQVIFPRTYSFKDEALYISRVRVHMRNMRHHVELSLILFYHKRDLLILAHDSWKRKAWLHFLSNIHKAKNRPVRWCKCIVFYKHIRLSTQIFVVKIKELVESYANDTCDFLSHASKNRTFYRWDTAIFPCYSAYGENGTSC